ncbi:hypothetical protein [Halocatena pleomorpha]|uniref:Uncharacterized protein n=1 Tax=Halocatena pleomorpha TaxID=1785090 RepID=A0A3P3RDK6_9EURY|nr:hypothetical protein [Halocatena pleomorpha]RRJ31404.1 hypothetical protein EIK79_06705 [Halocatena pleomorpha]
MVSRRTIIFIAGLILLSGLSMIAGEAVDAPPTMTATNDGDTTYRVTAYTVEDRRTALLMNFAVTTRDGERRLATLSQLIWPDGFRNVTLADDGIPTQGISVDPGEAVTTTIDGWTPGNVTVYVVEDLGNNETHVRTSLETCTKRGQEHHMTFEENGGGRTSVCGSSIDRLLP